MSTYAIPEITPGVYAVGSKDWKRRIFDCIAATPQGTTYNTYLVRGADKTALIDTIHKDFKDDLSGKINQILGSHAIDYVIMNHAEPDHAGSIMHILNQCSAKLLCTKKGAELAQVYYDVPDDRIQVVADGETIDLGGKSLTFIHAPFIHWPETMMTWLAEDGVLFSCDFFSAHNTIGDFDTESEDIIHWARKYYAEIMMPLAKMGRMAMAKLKNLDIKFIAPSHGPIYRDPSKIMAHYTDWTNEKTAPKAIILYTSMYTFTEKIALTIAENLKNQGIIVGAYDMVNTDAAELINQLLDTRALIIASPTLLGNIHPVIQYGMILIKTLRPPIKYGLFVNNYGWGKSATRFGVEFFEQAKIDSIGVIEINGKPGDEDFANITEASEILAKKILAD
ncbi:MAG: FprA family A-type flavoprotein [Candidatus Zixiibacteriota bacterium]